MKILMIIFAFFALLGAFDCIIGNKLGIGKEFEKGISSLGPLALSMVGMICISPILASLLLPIVKPLSGLFGFDPSVIIGCILANDMGGAPLALAVSENSFWGNFSGLIIGGMLGVTVSFTIPVSLATIHKCYHKDVLLGILCGICTIPIGGIAAGLLLKCALSELFLNLAPVILISVLVSIGILMFPTLTIKISTVFGKIISCIIYAGLGIGIFQLLSGYEIISGMTSVKEGLSTVSEIAVVLAGVLPLIYVISRVLSRLLKKIGNKVGISSDAIMGLISSLANSIPVFKKCEDMDRNGRILNMAFAVSAAFVFGDHLAFCTSFNSEFIVAMITAKLTAGISALILTSIVIKYKKI